MKFILKLRSTNFLVKYLAGFVEMNLKISKSFSFMLQVYKIWFSRVITYLQYLATSMYSLYPSFIFQSFKPYFMQCISYILLFHTYFIPFHNSPFILLSLKIFYPVSFLIASTHAFILVPKSPSDHFILYYFILL